MVYWSGVDLAAFSECSHRRRHANRERRRCAADRNHDLRGSASRDACLARDGLGRGALDGRYVHARSPPHQFWDNAAVSNAPLRKGGTMNTKKLALIALISSIVSPVAEAQIKHIEMRVEGMT